MTSSFSPPTGEQDDVRIPLASSEDTIVSVENFSLDSPGNDLPGPNGGNHLNIENGTVENVTFKKSHCIFKIPEFLTRNKQNFYGYQPTIVSIGPYHKGKQELQSIQEQKKRFENFFVSQANKEGGVSRDDLVRAVESKEQEIRDSYSEDLVGLGFPSKALIDMIILDGCFLLTLFLTVARNINYEDPIFNLPWVLSAIQRDLLLLENQLPLFVLQTLLDTAKLPSTDCITTIALKFFSYSFEKPRKCRTVNNICKAKHLLDLLRNTFIPISRQTTVNGLESGTDPDMASDESLKLILSARNLRSRGIKFKLKTNMVDTFLDISLDKGKLQIPKIILDDCISLLILNGIAYEQFSADSTNHITSYAMFMGCLINNGRDATLLEEEGIIQNSFGTEDEVSRFFKRITKDYTFDIKKSYLAPVFVGVNEYTANGFHVQWAGFMFTYFRSPWISVSSIAAFILLLLTLLQVIYAAGVLTPISKGIGNVK